MILYFDGASRNNPHGSCGYGFHIETNDINEDTTVQDSGYCGMEKNSNMMEYEGPIEGLIWATRLDLKCLTVNSNQGKWFYKNKTIRKFFNTSSYTR